MLLNCLVEEHSCSVAVNVPQSKAETYKEQDNQSDSNRHSTKRTETGATINALIDIIAQWDKETDIQTDSKDAENEGVGGGEGVMPPPPRNSGVAQKTTDETPTGHFHAKGGGKGTWVNIGTIDKHSRHSRGPNAALGPQNNIRNHNRSVHIKKEVNREMFYQPK